MTIIAKPPRWKWLLVAVVVGYAISSIVVHGPRFAPRSPAPVTAQDTAGVDTEATDQAISEALGQIPPQPVDSTVIKRGWRDAVPGVDLAAFDATQRETFLRLANSEDCTCGCGYTLAACRNFDLTCPVSLPRVEAMRDSVLHGLVASARGLRTRPRPEHP